MPVNPEQKQFFDQNGYVVIDNLFSEAEVSFYRDHYMRLRAAGTYPGDDAGVNAASSDPLRRYPRMIHMHRWDEVSLHWLLDPRLGACMTDLIGLEPFAVQTMLYFKPPKARGQAMHQDNYYLRVQPGTCIAAWLALDPCDVQNGCLEIVPGSHTWPLLCTTNADTSQSFTDVTVPLQAGQDVHPVIMDAGSVMFFNGSLVHGSKPNTTPDRFRRALIGHYVEGNTQEVFQWYHPALRFDGSVVGLEQSASGTRCGVWVEQERAFVTRAASQPFPAKSE